MADSTEDWVLIESDWNLKEHHIHQLQSHDAVLIESDWNLKEIRRLQREDRNLY